MRRWPSPASLIGLLAHAALVTATPSPAEPGRLATGEAVADSLLAEHRITDGMEPDFGHPIEYALDVDAARTAIALRGTLRIGVAAALGRALEAHPEVTTLVLDSDGGNVYQARALALLVGAHGLDTHVERRCHSACTLVYVAGTRRSLGEGASVGFHCYRIESAVGARPGVDPVAEQDKDLLFYADRIPDAGFVERIFHCRSPGLWLPAAGELLEAGVVHAILPR